MFGTSSGRGWGYLHAWPREGVKPMLGASSSRGLGYLHEWPWEEVLLMLGASSTQRLGILACMATGGSFTHVRNELRLRVGIS